MAADILKIKALIKRAMIKIYQEVSNGVRDHLKRDGWRLTPSIVVVQRVVEQFKLFVNIPISRSYPKFKITPYALIGT
jgi:hypothetical protein